MAKGTRALSTRDGKLKKLLVPTAAGVAGSALAVALTKKPKQLINAMPKQLGEVVPRVRDAMPEMPDGGIGEITDDLRGRLDSVLGKEGGDDDRLEGFEGQTPSRFDASKFEQRRTERRERREQRRRRPA
jgi:hypothetical protein